jgi:hypothetical protein
VRGGGEREEIERGKKVRKKKSKGKGVYGSTDTFCSSLVWSPGYFLISLISLP